MISAGIDIGSTTIKAVILGSEGVLASLITPAGPMPAETAKTLFAKAVDTAGIQKSDINIIATTGYGRRLVDFGDIVMTEIRACASGSLASLKLEEKIHTIIDVGGQDTKVISVNDDGEIDDFSMNDKCAAGTGRFLEVLALKLDMGYEEFMQQAAESATSLQMTSTCAVFAESEVVGLLARGEKKGDIASAAHSAIASRIASMIRRVGQRGAYCFVGGGARNNALVKSIEEHLAAKVHVPASPQSIVAMGAAIEAMKKIKSAV